MKDSPLIVQSDRTLLLDVHHRLADQCRADISRFCDLVKSPEHMHTYALTAISLWNAASCGLTCDKVLDSLEKWSRYDLTDAIRFFVTDVSGRFGKLILTKERDLEIPQATVSPLPEVSSQQEAASYQVENDRLNQSLMNLLQDKKEKKKQQEAEDFPVAEDDLQEEHYYLHVSDRNIAMILENHKEIEALMIHTEELGLYAVPQLYRGELKLRLIKLGYPVDDRIPLSRGLPIDFRLRKTTLSGENFAIRSYQEAAANAIYSTDGSGSGYGTLVLPCGSGKTIIGLEILARLKTRTLIITTNVAAVHQWIDEIRDKSFTDEVGEYTGNRKDIKDITVCSYQVLTWRPDTAGNFPHFDLLKKGNWGLIIYDEVHMLPAPVFKVTAELQSVCRVGLTATLVREDGRQDEVFSLVGPKRYDIPWSELEAKGFIAQAFCHEIRVPLPVYLELPFALAGKKDQFRIASENPAKIPIVESLLKRHEGECILVIGQYLQQLKLVAEQIGAPLLTGSTANKKRDELYRKFREKELKVLVVSKVANFAIDLPDASVAIQISGTFGSRSEEAQRLGRILRPKKLNSNFYSLVTLHSTEEDFAMNRQKFLAEQGYQYDVEIWNEEKN
ncbi:MAG: DEAD/DEAH box helicase [Spirochaetia bacterium]|jgi:DNA excision repair protein ERCC-3|nr:DEAD/DEAH box helicase [Spirochaetia bacterium]